jgi:hypothetical protein
MPGENISSDCIVNRVRIQSNSFVLGSGYFTIVMKFILFRVQHKNDVYLCGYTKYFRSDNEPDGIENATHNTFAKLTWTFIFLFKKHKT